MEGLFKAFRTRGVLQSLQMWADAPLGLVVYPPDLHAITSRREPCCSALVLEQAAW